jgi:triphosphoribosyl-dephospho-CoA synthase
MRDTRPHDLVRITSGGVRSVAASAPPWVARSLAVTPWAAVRRARAPLGEIAIGIRGSTRAERFAANVRALEVCDVVVPETLAGRTPARAHAAFTALAAVERAASACGLRAGPIGAAGFEIVTLAPALHDESDLDVIVRTSPSNPALRMFARRLRGLPVRIDVEVAFGDRCGAALDEVLAGNDVLVKMPSGPRLMRISTIADAAVQALLDEAMLTPKPALVDRRGSGAHADLTLELLQRSAHALRDTFAEIAGASRGTVIDSALRERLGEIGRNGERRMMAVTDGVNTHRGAIWTLGLLVAGQAIAGSYETKTIARTAAAIARITDGARGALSTNGERVRRTYGVGGAVGEAEAAFPHVVDIALPELRRARAQGEAEEVARVNTLLSIMTMLDDTCLLHRGGLEALGVAQRGARAVVREGGIATPSGARAFTALEAALLERRASPGGAADLLAAALFLDSIAEPL